MDAEAQAPRMWSDFDGTAVKLAKFNLIARAAKYPLPMVPGYDEFLGGVENSSVEIAGVVSRRPNIGIRRLATRLSVAQHGLRGYFNKKNIVLKSSERAKAEFIFEQSQEAVLGMVDDRPQKIGGELLKIFAREATTDDSGGQPMGNRIVLGVVDHKRNHNNIEELLDRARQMFGDESVEDFEYQVSENIVNTGYRIKVGRQVVEVVRLNPYSEDVGEKFAAQLLKTSD